MRIIEMSALIPITLVGDNLGKRHRDFNSLVSEALKLGEPIEDVLNLPEKSAIDRLFKIDLALKQKNVQYILKNMKESDMLYVSRALKAKWLLEEQYKEIINPVKLESDVYPEMTLPAANKMKHWIHLNLRDEIRCQEFYHYYRDSDRKLAMKYLLKCPADLIVKEIPIFFKDDPTFFHNKSSKYYITPHYFKMFCERTPLIAKLVYDLIDKDKSFRLSYMDQQYEYFDSLKCILKSDPDTFLDIAEKHFNVNQFRKLGSTATKFIMSHKKDRFIQKPELYAAWLLDMNELARCLSTKECKDLVIQLARSKFLGSWFDYKNVEPLIKRLDKNERTEFKKRVFVRKEVGEDVKNWPYPPPGPAIEEQVFEHDDSDYEEYDDSDDQGFLACIGMSAKSERGTIKTHLDFLYDEYRFKSFTETLFELSKKILAESFPRNRMHMLLVLVSKSGGKESNLEALFQMLMKHRNEPPPIRAAVIRSLVRRAAIWRVSDEIWDTVLKFGEGLGLDGGTPEAECEEGLHAVVIRSLINTGGLPSEIKAAFLKTFFPLITEYTLSNTEKSKIMKILPNLLLDSVDKETNGETAADIMEHLLDTLEVIEIQPNSYNEVIPAVKKLLERDQTAGKRILKRLFDSNIRRKDLFKENFDMIQLDHSYVNALKHDIGVLSVDKFLNTIVIENVELDRFLRKTSVYFAEDQGLASRLLLAMKKQKIHKNLARPIAFLIGSNLKTYISNMDLIREACKDNEDIKIFCAEIRANAHLARPEFDIDSFTWRKAGVKLVANRLVICRSVDVDKYIDESLLWKRSARLATVLAKRTDRVVEVLKTVATMRPTIAIKVALEYFRRDQSAPRIWKIVKPLIMKIEPENKYFHLLQKLENFHRIPESIRPEFIQIMFPLYLKKKPENSSVQFNQKQIYALILQQIHKLLPMMEPEFVDDLLMKFLQNEFPPGSKNKAHYLVHNKYRTYSDADMYLRILAKYLLLCTNENEQKERFARFGDLFFDIMEIYWQSGEKQKYHHYLNTFLQALKSNSAFFSNQYVSCLTVMQKIIKRMNTQLPMEQYLIVFVEVHLSMLYYLAVRQCVKTKPNIFVGEAKDQKKNKEGMMIIAHMFGKYIALEAQELIVTYFDSVVEIYGKGLKFYFQRFRETRHSLSLHLVRGIIEGSKGLEGRLAVGLYNEYHQNNEDWDKIRELMIEKFHKNTMFFFYNDIIANHTILTEW